MLGTFAPRVRSDSVPIAAATRMSRDSEQTEMSDAVAGLARDRDVPTREAGPAGRRGLPRSSLRYRTMSTVHSACSATLALTEPSNRPANPPRPRLPTTTINASLLASRRTAAPPP